MRCDVMRFVAFEDLGVWEAELAAQGYAVRYLDVGVDDLAEWPGADLCAVLGAPIDADDVARYPVLEQVTALVRERLDAGLPLLGICLGAQIMAVALGSSVRRGQREIGWAPVELTAAAAASPVARLTGAPVLHWHADTFDLPAGATLLASTAATETQAFAVGAALALQFHPEADPEAIERWLIGHTGDLTTWDIDPRDLRAAAREHGDAAVAAGLLMLRDYLAALSAPDSRVGRG